MSKRTFVLSALLTGGVLGFVGGLERWSQNQLRFAGAIATVIGVVLVLGIPDLLARRRRG